MYQQLLRNKLKLELKYEVNIRFETQIWKPGPDLKMKNLEMRGWIPGLNLEKICLKPRNGHFLVYFNKSPIIDELGQCGEVSILKDLLLKYSMKLKDGNHLLFTYII